MTSITLTRIDSTALYGSAPYVYFLLWSPDASAPASLTLDQIWDNSVGYLLLLNPAVSADASALESALREKLPVPERLSVAWVKYGGVPLVIRQSYPVPLNKLNLVSADSFIPLPPAIGAIGFEEGTQVTSSRDGDGNVHGVDFAYPTTLQAAAQPGFNFRVHLSGQSAGCLAFSGLRNMIGAASGDSITKVLFQVQIDPLNLTNSQRTFMTWTGDTFIFSHDADGYHLKAQQG